MKKILLFSAILIGAASASQAGGLNLRFGFPLPIPPGLVITHRAPVVVASRDCYEPQVAVAPPVCETPVVVRDDCSRDRYVNYDHRRFIGDREWTKRYSRTDRHCNEHYRWSDRDDYRACR